MREREREREREIESERERERVKWREKGIVVGGEGRGKTTEQTTYERSRMEKIKKIKKRRKKGGRNKLKKNVYITLIF